MRKNSRSVIEMNRFEGCKVLWKKRYRSKTTRLLKYVEAIIQTTDNRLYYVDGECENDSWEGFSISLSVHRVESFDPQTKTFKKLPGYVQISLDEAEYLEELLFRDV